MHGDLYDQMPREDLERLLPSGVLEFVYDTYRRHDHAPDEEAEAVPGAGVEAASFSGVEAAYDGDNRRLDDDTRSIDRENSIIESEKEASNDTSTMLAERDDHEQAFHDTREETGNHDHQPLDGTCEEPVASSTDRQFLEGRHEVAIEDDHGGGSSSSTHEELGNGNRGNKSDDSTHGEPVVIEGGGTFECTREETSNNMCEEADGGGTLVQDISETGGNVVPGEHDDFPGNSRQEANLTDAPQDSSSYREQESHSEPRSDPPRHRGRRRFVRRPWLDRWCHNAMAGRDKDNTSRH